MTIPIDLNILSRQRKPLMGVAIMLIMLFHSGWLLNNPSMDSIFRNGDCGVEMFAVLSGIGCSFSLKRNSSVLQFYKRRLLKILPTFVILALLYGLYLYFKKGASWKHVVSLSIGFATFRGDITFWFVSYILICYLLAPFLISIRNKINKPFISTLIVCAISEVLYLFLKDRIIQSYVWTLRFPAFTLGIDIASFTFSNITSSKGKCKSSLSLAIIELIILISILSLSRYCDTYEARYFCYLIMNVPIMIVLGNLIERAELLRKSLSFIGTLTFEIYLLHAVIVFPALYSILPINGWALLPIAIIATISLAKLFSCAISYLKRICGMPT